MKKPLIINFVLVGIAFIAIARWADLQNFKFTSTHLKNTSTQNIIEVAEVTATTPAEIIQIEPEDKLEVDPRQTLIEEAFAKKYGKDISSVTVLIDLYEDYYAKGTVDFDNTGNPANFYASSINGTWEVVAVENGVMACTSISGYNFSATMIPQCYDPNSGTVVNR